jgi:deoxyribodipyrimidine photo-lyase
MSTAIWWIRRDLRLGDNAALKAALENHSTVVPLFILDNELLKQSSPRRNAFLMAALHHLGEDLRSHGSRLIIRHGKPDDILANIFSESNAQHVYAQKDYSPYALKRDNQIANLFSLNLLDGQTIHPADVVRKADGSPYIKFTPFSAAWKALPLNNSILSAPLRLPECPPLLSEEISQLDRSYFWHASETSANKRLETFSQSDIYQYTTLRDRMDQDRTSHLSISLKFGLISPRQAFRAGNEASQHANTPLERASCQVWLNELVWREFFYSILWHHPQVLQAAFKPSYRAIQWNGDEKGLSAWKNGQTGYPIVDAAIRQMNETGWMHNRARMIVASFLVKDLHINWQEGEKYFKESLLDYDPSANNGNWQWSAGTGTDSVPYFRVFNPVLQSQKFDPDGEYIRRWLPELKQVGNAFIHTPWRMPVDIQDHYHCRIGKEYPAPIVDHAKAKRETFVIYRSAKAIN